MRHGHLRVRCERRSVRTCTLQLRRARQAGSADQGFGSFWWSGLWVYRVVGGFPVDGNDETTCGSCALRVVESISLNADEPLIDMYGALGRRAARCPQDGQSIVSGTSAIEKNASTLSPWGHRNS